MQPPDSPSSLGAGRHQTAESEHCFTVSRRQNLKRWLSRNLQHVRCHSRATRGRARRMGFPCRNYAPTTTTLQYWHLPCHCADRIRVVKHYFSATCCPILLYLRCPAPSLNTKAHEIAPPSQRPPNSPFKPGYKTNWLGPWQSIMLQWCPRRITRRHPGHVPARRIWASYLPFLYSPCLPIWK